MLTINWVPFIWHKFHPVKNGHKVKLCFHCVPGITEKKNIAYKCWNLHTTSRKTKKYDSVSVAEGCETLPVTVGAITGAGCLPPGFKPLHSREQDELFIWLTVNVPASSPHPHPRLTDDGQGSTHHCHICPSNCPPLALHPSQSCPKPTHCLATWTAPHFYLNHHPPATHPHVKAVKILDRFFFLPLDLWKNLQIWTKHA